MGRSVPKATKLVRILWAVSFPTLWVLYQALGRSQMSKTLPLKGHRVPAGKYTLIQTTLLKSLTNALFKRRQQCSGSREELILLA